jgi:hypothetical protein
MRRCCPTSPGTSKRNGARGRKHAMLANVQKHHKRSKSSALRAAAAEFPGNDLRKGAAPWIPISSTRK